MTKKLRDTLDEGQIKQRSQMMAILNLNLALVSIKQKNAAQIIKHSMEAIKIDPQNAKGHYRLYQGYKLNNDFELAKQSLVTAIKLQPNDPVLREEHKHLKELKSEKEKQWYSKMNGFYNKTKLSEIDQQETKDQLLKQKLQRKHESQRTEGHKADSFSKTSQTSAFNSGEHHFHQQEESKEHSCEEQ